MVARKQISDTLKSDKRGACIKQAESGLFCPDPKPDLDNANVGIQTAKIASNARTCLYEGKSAFYLFEVKAQANAYLKGAIFMLGTCLENVRKNVPLVHNITNYVTVNDVANALLACGGSPIMSDEPEDVEDITGICGGLNINIGTLNARSIEGMKRAAAKAQELGHTLTLDPVGAGASRLRTNTALDLMSATKFNAIRGNISEIKTLALGSGTTKGVDADIADTVTDNTLDAAVDFAKNFAAEHDCIVAITGAIDLVSSADECYVIRNGRAEMSKITGTGCQLSAVLCAYLVANPENQLEAAAAAVCSMGLAGEIAWSRMQNGDGNSTYRNRIIDALYNMTAEQLDEGARFELR